MDSIQVIVFQHSKFKREACSGSNQIENVEKQKKRQTAKTCHQK